MIAVYLINVANVAAQGELAFRQRYLFVHFVDKILDSREKFQHYYAIPHSYLLSELTAFNT